MALSLRHAGDSVVPMVANRYPEIAFGPAALARQAAVGHTPPTGSGEFGLEGTDIAQIRRADHFFLSTVTESGWAGGVRPRPRRHNPVLAGVPR